MKTISYTKMREELADILDALRNGEEIIVTQRGRDDLVLSAKGVMHNVHSRGWYKVTESGLSHAISSDRAECPVSEPGPKMWFQVLRNTTKKISFDEAKEKTRTKHAKIIKALEDK